MTWVLFSSRLHAYRCNIQKKRERKSLSNFFQASLFTAVKVWEIGERFHNLSVSNHRNRGFVKNKKLSLFCLPLFWGSFFDQFLFFWKDSGGEGQQVTQIMQWLIKKIIAEFALFTWSSFTFIYIFLKYFYNLSPKDYLTKPQNLSGDKSRTMHVFTTAFPRHTKQLLTQCDL